MNKQILIHFPWEILIDWHKKHERKTLPWRQYTVYPEDILLYRVWLSEILLQQTQASRVISFFERIVERYPTIHSLSETDYETFFPYYQWLWYYSRAKNLLKTAHIISTEFLWTFPNNIDLLKKLPWVWEYTANAILAFWYGETTLSWDTNLEKVFARYYNGTKETKLGKTEKEAIERDFREFIAWKDDTQTLVRSINNALMDFSALIDLKNPEIIHWEEYIFTESKFYTTRWALESSEEKQKHSFPIPDATIIVTLHENHRIYYSEKREKYTPFVLAPSMTRDVRGYIQSYFKKNYNLELSVRPVHKKWLSDDGKPYIAVNAQVQVGKILFEKWDKKSI